MQISARDKNQINRAVAEVVAGWPRRKVIEHWLDDRQLGPEEVLKAVGQWRGPAFTDSADAVLPLLEKSKVNWLHCFWPDNGPEKRHKVHILDHENPVFGIATTFPLAACVALLRAHGVTVTD